MPYRAFVQYVLVYRSCVHNQQPPRLWVPQHEALTASTLFFSEHVQERVPGRPLTPRDGVHESLEDDPYLKEHKLFAAHSMAATLCLFRPADRGNPTYVTAQLSTALTYASPNRTHQGPPMTRRHLRSPYLACRLLPVLVRTCRGPASGLASFNQDSSCSNPIDRVFVPRRPGGARVAQQAPRRP